MAEQYCGKLEKKLSQNNVEYFKGRVMGVPVVAFWGKKDPNSINVKLDVGLIKWIDDQDENQEKTPPVPNSNVHPIAEQVNEMPEGNPIPDTQEEELDDLPF